MLVHEFLENSARRLSNKTALIFQDQRLTYIQINETANQLAHALINAGLKRGDRVAIFLDNSIEAVISIYGVLKAGGVFSTLSPTLKARKLEYILNNLESSFLISQWGKYQIVWNAINNTSFLKSIIMCDDIENKPQYDKKIFKEWNEFINSQPNTNQEIQCIDIDLANIIFTSGSTADPRGVMMTHLNMISVATSIIQYLKNSEKDIILNVLPLSFDYGLYQIIMAFMFGGTVVLERSFLYSYAVVNRIIKEKVTGFPGVPSIFAILLQLKNLDKIDFEHLRYFTSTGDVLPISHIKALREIFPHVKI